MAMDMPPWTWASASAGLMRVPQSWTLTRFSSFTLHRGTSIWAVVSAVMCWLCSRE